MVVTDPALKDAAKELNANLEINLTKALAHCYGVGFDEASKMSLSYDPPQLRAQDTSKLVQDSKRLIKPIYDYNSALADKISEIVEGGFASGKDDYTVANELRQKIPEILNMEPITIQRPGKRAVSFTADTYANMVADTVPYAVRNAGYVRGLEEGGVSDGWISDATLDERMCPMCGAKHGKLFSWSDPQPPYHPGCRCRPVAHYPKSLHELAEQIRARKAAEANDKESAKDAKDIANQLVESIDSLSTRYAAPGIKVERPKLDIKPLPIEKSKAVQNYMQMTREQQNRYDKKYVRQDSLLHDIASEIGFDGKPVLVSGNEMDQITKAGHKELFRGVSDEKFADEFKKGEYFAGAGIFGNGIYTAYGEKGLRDALAYSNKEAGSLIRMALDKDAKVITYNDLKVELAKYWDSPDLATSMIASDPGKFAALKGYDAIDYTDTKYMIVLNRRALYVVK